MTIVLLAVGLLATAAGFVTIGFGIPINAFSLGNTLIISGTIAAATGLILIGLALAIGQLRRIVEAIASQPRAARTAESIELATPRVVMSAAPASARQPELSLPEFEPAPEPVRAPEPRHEVRPEPRQDVRQDPRHAEPHVPAPAAEAPGPLDWLRAKTRPAVAATPMTEPPMVELTDEAPLSPRSPQRPVMPPAAEPANEPKVWSPSRDSAAGQTSAPPRVEQPMPRATSQAEPPREKDRFGFDLVWPDRSGGAPAPAPAAETPKREPVPALDMPMPPVPVRPREPRVAVEKRAEPPAPRKPAAERAPAILKSGVIDGMPYTLYADGSIEAQLPQGTVKFASVDALRAHLEKQT